MDSIESAERSLLCAIFRSYPDAWVWIGGSVLHLVHASPRASYDLDLAPRAELPPPAGIIRRLGAALDEWNMATGNRFRLERIPGADTPAFFRLTVNENGEFRFSLDFTRIAGGLGQTTAIVIESALGPEAVVIPTDASLLALKVEALLFRRFLKPADVFDAWFLLSTGVRLTKPQREWLSDRLAMEEMSLSDLEGRLQRLTPAKFLTDLRRWTRAGPLALWDERKARSAIGRVAAFLRKELRA